MNSKPIIKIENLYKSFNVGKGKVDVLKGIDLEIYNGEFVIIFGPSGCGKSTLLNTLVGLEIPTRGTVSLKAKDIYEYTSDERAVLRRKDFGIIHQQSNWIKSLNVLENVAFPLYIKGNSTKGSNKKAHSLLTLFRLEGFEKNTPTELSGGQQQRVSVARALVANPLILIADEPTGNLDTVSAADLMYALQFLNNESKRTIIMVTHNPDYEKYATKIVKMEDGKIREINVKVKKNVPIEESQQEIVPEDNEVKNA